MRQLYLSEKVRKNNGTSELTRIDHDDVVLVVAVEVIDQVLHLVERKVIAEREDFVLVHIINICPCQSDMLMQQDPRTYRST